MKKYTFTKNRVLIAVAMIFLIMHTAIGMVGVSPKTTAEAENLAIWDGSVATAFSGGDGTAATPFLIADGKELVLLADLMNFPSSSLTVGGNVLNNAYLREAHYKLTADIKLNDTTDWQSWTDIVQPANKFRPIGYLDDINTKYNYFSGIFDGDNHTIAGLYNTGAVAGSPVGLFGLIYGAEIKNVGVIESAVFGNNMVGAIASYIYLDESIPEADRIRSKITNCFNTGNVTGKDIQVGGIVGNALLVTIEDCYNTGKITSKGIGGGIAGSATRKTQIINCNNEGELDVNGNNVGGIVADGQDDLIVDNCFNKGAVTGKEGVGGIFGSYGGNLMSTPTAITVKNSYNEGVITTSKYGVPGSTVGSVGGIVGRVTGKLTVDRCYNTGNVTNKEGNYTGGIVGSNSVNSGAVPNKISNCYNTGNISSDGLILGGIAGNNMGASSVINCYNNGEIIGKNNMTGGIVGTHFTSGSKLENCYNSGQVRVLGGSATKVGAISGDARNGLTDIKNNYYLIDNTFLQGSIHNKGIGETTDAAKTVTSFKPSNDGTNGGEDGDGTFDPAITVDGVAGVTTSLLAALNIYTDELNAVTADAYNSWYQGKTVSSYPDFLAATIFTMTFDANGGTGSMTNQSFTDGIPQNIATNTFTKALHKFSGWNTAADGSGTPYAAGASLTLFANGTLYAQWTALEQYTVTFNANGGTGSMTNQTFTETVAQNITTNTFTRALFKFNGWNTAADGSGTAYTDGQSATLAGNVTLYAQWTAYDEYTVTFNANGGTGSMASQTFYEITAQNITVNTFTKALHKFSGWNTAANGSGTPYTDGQSVTLTGDVTLYAQWTALAQYTVTFNANGGSGSMASQTFYEDTAQSITANSLTKDGYKFSGWNTAANGSGTPYAAGASVTLNASTTLYAQWTALAQYTVTFDANGGTGSMASQNFYEDTAQKINANTFSRNWYKFTGWSTSATGVGGVFPTLTVSRLLLAVTLPYTRSGSCCSSITLLIALTAAAVLWTYKYL